jgi:hypothetical protein
LVILLQANLPKFFFFFLNLLKNYYTAISPEISDNISSWPSSSTLAFLAIFLLGAFLF